MQLHAVWCTGLQEAHFTQEATFLLIPLLVLLEAGFKIRRKSPAIAHIHAPVCKQSKRIPDWHTPH